MNKQRKKYIESCKISSLECLNLGGYKQKILIEGKEENLPIVVCLHGGPGSPFPFSVGCRGLYPDLTDQFIMVYWDQLGCGINNYEINNHFTIEHFVTMTNDLIKELKKRFPQNKIYLFGMSWGSILTLKAASLIPELIDGVITFGQVLTAPMLSQVTFDAIEQSKASERKKEFARQLKAKEIPFSPKNLMLLSKIIRKYTNGYVCKEAKSTSLWPMMKSLITSPDYTFKDFLAVFNNGYKRNESLIMEMSTLNLKEELKNMTIPYYIYQGETDIVTNTKDIVDFSQETANPFINVTILPKTGHFPNETIIRKIFEQFKIWFNKCQN